MNDFVFVDANNGHFEEYFNFQSNASEQEIKEMIEKLDTYGSYYKRMGMSYGSFEKEMINAGYELKLLNNPRDRLYIDRTIIRGISGNY